LNLNLGRIILQLIRDYGWPIPRYGPTEKSLRIDIDAAGFSERDFVARINQEVERVELHFDSSRIPSKDEYQSWLEEVRRKVGPSDLPRVPYWTFEDLDFILLMQIAGLRQSESFFASKINQVVSSTFI
jgi:hypothetical protein